MAELRRVEEGWLARTVSNAIRQLHVQFSPQEMMRMGKSITLPIPDDEAAQLYADLDAHFQAWTGKSLAEWKRDSQ